MVGGNNKFCLLQHIGIHQNRIHFNYTSILFCTLLAGADWGKKVARELLSDRPTQYTARGPLSTRRLPSQYTARCPLNASHVSTSQWPTWKNTHTLNITLDDYKEITSYIYIFYNIWIHQFGHTGWTHGIK